MPQIIFLRSKATLKSSLIYIVPSYLEFHSYRKIQLLGHVGPKSGYMGSPVLPVNPGSVQNNINQKYAIHPSLTSNQYSAKHLYQHPANYKPGVHILPQYLQQHR